MTTTTVIILAALFATLTYAVLHLWLNNKWLRRRIEEAIETARAYDDAANMQTARADKAERDLKEANAKLARFDHENRKRRADGRFISEDEAEITGAPV